MSAPATLRDLRRGQIVAAARAIVAKDGLEALTIAALEARLGYSRGVITYHFDDKEEIVHAVLASTVLEIDQASLAAVEQSATREDKVRAVIRQNVRGFVDNVEAGRILLSFWARLSSDARAKKATAELYATYRRRTQRLLEGLPAVDAPALATAIVGVVIGIATQWYFEPKAIDVDAAIEEASCAVVARLPGARASTASRAARGPRPG